MKKNKKSLLFTPEKLTEIEKYLLLFTPEKLAEIEKYWAIRKDITYDDRPRGWLFEYEDATDLCLPKGWYAQALDKHKFRISWLVFGPFKTRQWAVRHSKKVEEDFESLPHK